jgi:hypothetical protein
VGSLILKITRFVLVIIVGFDQVIGEVENIAMPNFSRRLRYG